MAVGVSAGSAWHGKWRRWSSPASCRAFSGHLDVHGDHLRRVVFVVGRKLADHQDVFGDLLHDALRLEQHVELEAVRRGSDSCQTQETGQ